MQNLFTIAQTIAAVNKKLQEVTTTPLLEAALLLAHVLNKSRAYLHAYSEMLVDKSSELRLESLVTRRLNKEPLAYILGYKEFWQHTFVVTPATLIPRPETELLVELAFTLFSADEKICAVDLGTGCGAIALSLAAGAPKWQVFAIDYSWDALMVAKTNASANNISHVTFVHGDWCQALRQHSQDLIVANPPYIAAAEWHLYEQGLRYEPANALKSGQDGLDDIRRIVQAASKILKRGGHVLIEHGHSQGTSVRQLFSALKFCGVRTYDDLSGQERVTVAQLAN